MTRYLIGFLAILLAAPAAAQGVALVGVIGDKAAVLSIDGGEPKTVRVGERLGAVRVIGVGADRATVEIDGLRSELTLRAHHARPRTDERQSIRLAADAQGHFFTEGTINGKSVRFVVDTGATVIALPAQDARRMGIDYRKGRPGQVATAGGTVDAYPVRFETVRIGDIELHGVEGVVLEQSLGVALLGMSFLNRLEMQRNGAVMTLIRRY